MAEARSAQLSVALSQEANARLFFEAHDGQLFGQFNLVWLRLYPAVSATLRAVGGTISFAEHREHVIENEIVEFSGSDRATPRYPVTSNFVWRNLSGGAAWNIDGEPVFPAVSFDPVSGEVVASEPFYGGVVVDYWAQYRVVRFEVENIADEGFAQGPAAAFAYFEGATATTEVSIEFGGIAEEKVLLYQVYSETISDANGQWETPPNWPDSNAYPIGITANGNLPDPDNSHDNLRVHEQAYIDSHGFVQRFDGPFIRWAQPYEGSANYRPDYYWRKGSFTADFEIIVGDHVDWEEVGESIESRYRDVVER